MGGLQENKKQSPRYPMGNIKQCKSTLARLTRDVLTKKLSANEARAAAYLISQQIQLLKIETPEKKDVEISIGKPNWVFEMSNEERDQKISELLNKSLPFYSEYIQYAKVKASEINKIKGDNLFQLEEALHWQQALSDVVDEPKTEMEILFKAASQAETLPKTTNAIITSADNITPDSEQETESPPTKWKQCGIGAKRG